MTGSSAPLRLDYKSDLIDGIDSVELLAAGIQTTRRGQSRFVAYTDIKLVRLRYAPRRGMPEFYICTIEPRAGKPLRFGSLTHQGFVHGYEPVPYRAFVQELHARIAAAGGRPEFWAGEPTGQFALQLLGTIVAAFVGIGMVLSDKRMSGWMIVPLLVFLGWMGWPLIRRLQANETRRYSPRAIPDNLLPKDPA